MKKSILTITSAALCAFMLCACTKKQPTTDGETIVVNLSTPQTSASTFENPVNQVSYNDRYLLKSVISENDGGFFVSSKLFIRYTNTTNEPLYALTFNMPEGILIKDVSINSTASNFTADKENATLTIPTGAGLAPSASLAVYITYTANNITDVSNSILRFNQASGEFLHTVSLTVPSTYSVSSSLGTPEISSSTSTTYSFSAMSKNDFTIEVK